MIFTVSPRSPQRPSDRVTAELRAAVVSGEWAPGEQLPSIIALASRFGTSRTTAQRAVHRLAEEGLLTVVAQWGVFIPEATR